MGLLYIMAVLYGVLPMCGLSAYLALKREPRAGIGLAVAVACLLATVHVLSWSALWAELFQKPLTGPAWELFAVSKKTGFGIGYTGVMLTGCAVCLLLNLAVLVRRRRSKWQTAPAGRP